MKRIAAGFRNGAVLVGLALVVHGCAISPFEGLWPFHRPDPSSLSRAEPEQVRVALSLPQPARPRADGVTLVVRLSGADRSPSVTRLAMTLVNEGRIVRADRLPTADPGYSWYLFKLTPTAENELRALQLRLPGHDELGYDEVAYSAEVAYENVGSGQSLNRSIRLQLADAEGFITLTEGVHIVGQDNGGAES